MKLTLLAAALALSACANPAIYSRPDASADTTTRDWTECRNLRLYGTPEHTSLAGLGIIGSVISNANNGPPLKMTQDECMAKRGYSRTAQ